jgi:CRISPR-associated protein Cmx8
MVNRVYSKKKTVKKKKSGEEDKFQPRVFLGKTPDGKFEYKELRPALKYFEVFKSSEVWQKHIQDSCWRSFLCIPKTQELFQPNKDVTKSEKIFKLWETLTSNRAIGIEKSLYLNALGDDLKAYEIETPAKYAFLLHFWSLVSTFFTPKGIKFEKGELKDEFHPRVILIPEVINTGRFTRRFMQDLSRDELFPGSVISTSLEASLAFFAPQLAYYKTIDPSLLGVRGAEIYSYRSAGKQSVVSRIESEFIGEDLIREYQQTLNRLTSLPYRSLRIENLINGRTWHEGFEQLIARYPISLFVATKPRDGNERGLDRRAAQMARSIRDDVKYHEEEDRRMKRVSPETLIWRVVRGYVKWQACNKAGLSLEEVNKALKKAEGKRPIEPPELRKKYADAVQEVTEKAFISFRGRRDKDDFADAFSDELFRAPIPFSAEQAEMIRPYYEGDAWESGRRLVLMAISAAGASASFGTSEDNSSEQDDLDIHDESDDVEVDGD